MPRGVVEFLARRMTSSIRELEGALNRIAAYAMMTGRAIDVAFVEEVLANVLRANQRRISIDEIQTQVAEHYRIRKAEMTSARRAREVARPRQVAMYLSKQLTPKSLPDIGRRFGGRDHTTVIHAVKQIERLRASGCRARCRHPPADAPAGGLILGVGRRPYGGIHGKRSSPQLVEGPPGNWAGPSLFMVRSRLRIAAAGSACCLRSGGTVILIVSPELPGEAGEHRLDQARHDLRQIVGPRAGLGLAFEQRGIVDLAADVEVKLAHVNGVAADRSAADSRRTRRDRPSPNSSERRP